MGERRGKGTSVAVWEAGEGRPLLLIHGLGLDHHGLAEVTEGLFDQRSGLRRVYLDLPGMGETTAGPQLASADATLAVLEAVVDESIGTVRSAAFGQSYGGCLSLGLLSRRPAQVSGLGLVVPVVEPAPSRRVLAPSVKRTTDDAAMGRFPGEIRDVFRDFVVVETTELAQSLEGPGWHRSWLQTRSSSQRCRRTPTN